MERLSINSLSFFFLKIFYISVSNEYVLSSFFFFCIILINDPWILI